METDMVKRFNNYIMNSIKVAILGFMWFILFQVPWASLPKAPLGGKLIAAAMLWAVWSFMVMIVSCEIGNGK
jgi:formate hydrogenlyase subunit 4